MSVRRREYRENGILALMSLFPEDQSVIFFERQIDALSKTDREYFSNVYQLCGDVISGKDMTTTTVLKPGFEHANWDDVHLKKKKKTVITVEDSVLQCNKCKSNKVLMDTRQTRGGDEGATVFATCTNCGTKWITRG